MIASKLGTNVYSLSYSALFFEYPVDGVLPMNSSLAVPVTVVVGFVNSLQSRQGNHCVERTSLFRISIKINIDYCSQDEQANIMHMVSWHSSTPSPFQKYYQVRYPLFTTLNMDNEISHPDET